MLRRIWRRLIERYYLTRDLGAPPSRTENGLCAEPHCRWPYHSHELFRNWK